MILEFSPLNQLIIISFQKLASWVYRRRKCDSLLMINLKCFLHLSLFIILLYWFLNMIHFTYFSWRPCQRTTSPHIPQRRYIFTWCLISIWLWCVCLLQFWQYLSCIFYLYFINSCWFSLNWLVKKYLLILHFSIIVSFMNFHLLV